MGTRLCIECRATGRRTNVIAVFYCCLLIPSDLREQNTYRVFSEHRSNLCSCGIYSALQDFFF